MENKKNEKSIKNNAGGSGGRSAQLQLLLPAS
jgi:hypothetical protein